MARRRQSSCKGCLRQLPVLALIFSPAALASVPSPLSPPSVSPIPLQGPSQPAATGGSSRTWTRWGDDNRPLRSRPTPTGPWSNPVPAASAPAPGRTVTTTVGKDDGGDTYGPWARPALVTQIPEGHRLGKRWPGYFTTTVFVGTATVTAGQGGGGGGVQTVTVTQGQDATVTDSQTVTVTQAQVTVTVTGAGVIVGGQQTTSTTTVYVAATEAQGLTTSQSTSTVFVGAGGAGGQTLTSTAHVGGQTAAGLRDDRPCYDGEQNQKYPGTIEPTNPTQTSTLYAIGIYWIAILVGWNLFLVRQLFYPAKLLVVAWHEFGHVLTCAFTGVHLQSVTIDPNEGGSTRMDAPAYPVVGLPAGYIMSLLIGGALTFAGFDTLAAKIASFFIGISWLVVFWWAAGLLTRALTLAAIGLMIALWFIDHTSALRYYVLFFGVMSSNYVIYDSMDDFLFRKVNPCCSVLFEERFGRLRAGIWALIWIGISTLWFTLWIILALLVWRETPRGMFCQSQQFLPT